MNIGIEFEFTGANRYQVASALQKLFGNQSQGVDLCEYVTSCSYSVCGGKVIIFDYTDYKGRVWRLNQDVSIQGENNHVVLNEDEIGMDYHLYCNEIQTPVLDIDNDADTILLADFLHALRQCGCYCNSSCALHIHIDRPDDITAIRLFNNVLHRQNELAKELDERKLTTFARLYSIASDTSAWTSYDDIQAYIQSNYHFKDFKGDPDYKHFIVNFCSVHNTVEFRCFWGTLDYDTIISHCKLIHSMLV